MIAWEAFDGRALSLLLTLGGFLFMWCVLRFCETQARLERHGLDVVSLSRARGARTPAPADPPTRRPHRPAAVAPTGSQAPVGEGSSSAGSLAEWDRMLAFVTSARADFAARPRPARGMGIVLWAHCQGCGAECIASPAGGRCSSCGGDLQVAAGGGA
jgi:hypothetical protein